MSRLVMKTLMFGLLALAVTACSNDPPKVGSGDAQKPGPVDIGNLIFAEAAWPKYPEDKAVADPIRLPLCHLTVLNRVDVPSKEDGTIEWLGIEVKGNANDPLADLFTARNRKQYRRLRIGDQVVKGQIIALLNDDRAFLEVDIAYKNIKGAESEFTAATEAITHYRANLKIEVDANSSKSAIVGAQASLAKAIAEQSSKEWEVKRAEGEKQKADEKLRNHFIKAPITGEVIQLLKQVGEGVKASEPILQLQNTNRLGVEGNLEVQYASSDLPGSEVFLEPAIMEPPLPWRSPHASSKPIAAVATGKRDGKQVIISASEDGTVKVWNRDGVYATWKHDGAVRALACSPSGLVLTGCDDGKARLWAINEEGQTPLRILDGHHEGGVQAAAFSPDGALCATSDDRGDIYLFETESGKRLYQFPREHNGAVSALHFTPQCRLISVGRDNVALVWKVGDKSAAVATTFDHRSGEVTNLGVTDDGGQMLLDLDKNRLRVVDLAGNHNRGTLQQPSDSKFSGFALFSPKIDNSNDRVILTSGGSDGVLQLWRWTAGVGRGSELKKLVCTNYAPATCAAFTSDAKDGFIVVGTQRGDVHVWNMPVSEEMNNRFKAKITHIDPNLDSSGRTVRILAEFDNSTDPHLRLRPGTTTTMVIPQK